MKVTLQLAKTVIIRIFPWMFLCCGYAFIISLFYYWKILPSIIDSRICTNIVFGITLSVSFLLIFKTQMAQYRFCEVNRFWRRIVNVVQNTVSGIWIYIGEQCPEDRDEKEAAIRLVVAFAIAMKLYVRKEPVNIELESLVLPLQYQKLQVSKHTPLDITFWISDYLHSQYDRKQINVFQLTYLQHCRDEMANIVKDYKPVFKSSFFSIYTVILQKIIVFYFIVSPLGFVSIFGWKTSLAMAFISFAYLFINEIGTEIEKPFSHSFNENLLDFICDSIEFDIEELISQTYCSQPIPIINLPNRIA